MAELLAPAVLEHQDGLPYRQRPWASSKVLGNYSVGEKPDQKIFTEKIYRRSVKMGPPRTLQMTPRIPGPAYELKDWKDWKGVRLSSMPVIPKPRNSCPTPEQSPLRHPGTPSGCTLSHRMWQIVQQLSFWHSPKQKSWACFCSVLWGPNRQTTEQKTTGNFF